MKAHRLVITFVAAAVMAFAIGAGVASTGGDSDWLDALNARSAALNEKYGLGDGAARRTLESPGPNWLQALMARSDAMNRAYGLGKYARQTARTIELASLNPEHPGRSLDMAEVDWIARIIWASQ